MVTLFQNEAALSLALEASRNEASALKLAYSHALEKYEETKKAYESLLDQLKEEVSPFFNSQLIAITKQSPFIRVPC